MRGTPPLDHVSANFLQCDSPLALYITGRGNSDLTGVTTFSFLLTWWALNGSSILVGDLHLGRLLQGAFVVGHELLNSFCGEIVPDIKTLPHLIQFDRFEGN